MQIISGSIGLSLPTASLTDNADISPSNQVDMSSGLGFLALFTTQIDSATAQLEEANGLSDLLQGELPAATQTMDLNGNIIPQDPLLAAKLAKQHVDLSGLDLKKLELTRLDPKKLDLAQLDLKKLDLTRLDQTALDQLKGELVKTDGNLDKVVTQLLGSSLQEEGLFNDKFPAVTADELKSVKALLEGLVQNQNVTTAPAPAHGQITGDTLSRQTTIPTMAINSPPGSQPWGSELVSQVKWQIGQDIQEARIQLNPRDLGPVQVKININDDQATVHFVAQHVVVRDAIEDAMPRLREMLEQSGLNLADANVSQGSQGEQQAFSREGGHHEQINDSGLNEVEEEQGESVVRTIEGLVDAFV